MKSLSRVIFLAMLLLVTVTSEACLAQNKQKQRGVKVKTKTPAAQAFKGKVYDNMWAVVIGVNKYQRWPKLDYAVDDARSVKKLLVSKYGFRSEHIMELLDDDATLINIRTTLGGVLLQKLLGPPGRGARPQCIDAYVGFLTLDHQGIHQPKHRHLGGPVV